MNRILTIAIVVCVILFVLAMFISPMVDIQPSALRAQQWLSFIVGLISLVVQMLVCLVKIPLSIGPASCERQVLQRVRAAELSCCLIC